MTLSEYRSYLALARCHTRTDTDAADLLHEALLAGVGAGRLAFNTPKERAWLSGVMRNLAAATARAAARRKSRESRWARDELVAQEGAPEPAVDSAPVLTSLSEGTRRVAVLALHGMNPDEICYVLQLKPAAFRQRLTALRRSLGKMPEPLRKEALALAFTRPRRSGDDRLDFGLIRRALLHHVQGGNEIGTHDPDGHLLGIRTR